MALVLLEQIAIVIVQKDFGVSIMAFSKETANHLSFSGITENQVFDYLKRHPDFLNLHPELLGMLSPPSQYEGNTVIDFQNLMIKRLNKELQSLRNCTKDLIFSSHNNITAQTRVHEAALLILQSGHIHGLHQTISKELPHLLGVSSARIIFEKSGKIMPSCLSVMKEGQVANIIGNKRVLLRQSSLYPTSFFGSKSSEIKSYALARLSPGNNIPSGFFALGATQEENFHEDDGAELIIFLSQIIEDCILRWWPSA
jgi:uncharacterized protein YigA (DUF484 family)